MHRFLFRRYLYASLYTRPLLLRSSSSQAARPVETRAVKSLRQTTQGRQGSRLSNSLRQGTELLVRRLASGEAAACQTVRSPSPYAPSDMCLAPLRPSHLGSTTPAALAHSLMLGDRFSRALSCALIFSRCA